MRYKVIQRSQTEYDPKTGLGVIESDCGHKHLSLETAYRCYLNESAKLRIEPFHGQIVHENGSPLSSFEKEQLKKIVHKNDILRSVFKW